MKKYVIRVQTKDGGSNFRCACGLGEKDPEKVKATQFGCAQDLMRHLENEHLEGYCASKERMKNTFLAKWCTKVGRYQKNMYFCKICKYRPELAKGEVKVDWGNERGSFEKHIVEHYFRKISFIDPDDEKKTINIEEFDVEILHIMLNYLYFEEGDYKDHFK